VPGSENAVYIEDNRFYNIVSGDPAYFWGGSAVQNYYGARTVFRYNYCRMCQIDVHGTAGNVGGRWWEIYENTFDIVPNGNQSAFVVLRAGSGVVFNNRKTGSTNLGGGAIHMYEEDSGYPAAYQVGRGKNQALEPAYIWGNSGMSIQVGEGSIQAGRDYYTTSKPGYSPYVYPHPLSTGQEETRPEAPAGLTIAP
jgi:hypothetical protein